MRTEGQTSIHLLLASIVTIVGVMLILLTLSMSWEPWMVPVIQIGNTLVWILHITRAGSETFYENLCSGLLMVGFFFFGVHEIILFDIPAIACMLILVFSMFDKKRLLYMTMVLYMLLLLYHYFLLQTITHDMKAQDLIRLGFGTSVVAGAIFIAKYRINRRRETRKNYDSTLVQLEKAGQQNAEFLSNVSHELRTPINMVLGLSEVILEKDISPEIREDMESIKLAGKRLSNQINNMLDYTEIVEGTLTPAKEPYRITSIFNDIITMTAMQSSKHQLEMVFDLDPKIPSVLIGDSEKLSHVLKIILENSIKFTEEGGLYVYMGFRRESYGINLIIDIYDTGIGMTNAQMIQMCDDFYQADSGSSRFAGGLGLGLPIARGLLHAMGGFIHFESKEQQGLQVHITIPQGVEDDKPAMVLSDPKKLCIACYFRPEKYSTDEVKRYYDNMILHMVEGLNIEGYQAHNFEGLLKLQKNHRLSHVFIAQAEYEENSAYYEDLAIQIRVVVIAEREFMLSRSSRLLIIHKPFFALSVVNLLNGDMKENGFGEAQAAGRKPFSCENVRVLAVDDEEMNLVVAKGVLGSYGIQVDTCLSGKEAIEKCISTTYDVIFLDHMMPGFDGIETLKQIRTINNGIYQELPVIALTANTISGAREMFRNEGFTEFIPKPIERAVLERVLRKVLSKNQVQYDEIPMAPDEIFEDMETPVLNEADNKNQEVQEKPPTQKNTAKTPTIKQGISKKKALRKERQKKKVLEKKTQPEETIQKETMQNETMQRETMQKETMQKETMQEKIFPEKSLMEESVPEEIFPEEAAAKSSSVSPYEALAQIGVNIQLGLDYCCGEDEFFMEMLRMFSSQAAEKKAEIIAYYEEGNWTDYAIKVHALKSTSLTIGAEQLAEQAKLLEQAGKAGNIEYIRHSHPTLMHLYDQICMTIDGL